MKVLSIILIFLLIIALSPLVGKMALLLSLLLWGLIFRTQQTLAVLGLFAVLAAFAAHPGIGIITAGVFGYIVWRNISSKRSSDR